MMIREYMPKGFSNWTAYYQHKAKHKAKVAKIKKFGEYFLSVVLILGVIAADSIADSITSLMF